MNRTQETIPATAAPHPCPEKSTSPEPPATGNLGGHIARALIARGAHLRVLGRPSSDPARIIALQQHEV